MYYCVPSILRIVCNGIRLGGWVESRAYRRNSPSKGDGRSGDHDKVDGRDRRPLPSLAFTVTPLSGPRRLSGSPKPRVEDINRHSTPVHVDSESKDKTCPPHYGLQWRSEYSNYSMVHFTNHMSHLSSMMTTPMLT